VEATLEITRESLQQRYSDLADAELLRRAGSGALTELAREVALAELAERGISLDDVEELPLAQHSTIEFAADEFERNPYQAPRTFSTPAPVVTRSRSGRVLHWLWLAYIGALSAVLVFVTTIAYAQSDEVFDPAYVLMWSGLAGIIAWRRRSPLFHPMVWIVCFAGNLAYTAVELKAYVDLLLAVDGHRYVKVIPVWFASMLAWQLPLLWGLARYGFGSRAIWQRGATPGTA
jgi:hypothetical protein